jgi:hypothetical protein
VIFKGNIIIVPCIQYGIDFYMDDISSAAVAVFLRNYFFELMNILMKSIHMPLKQQLVIPFCHRWSDDEDWNIGNKYSRTGYSVYISGFIMPHECTCYIFYKSTLLSYLMLFPITKLIPF